MADALANVIAVFPSTDCREAARRLQPLMGGCASGEIEGAQRKFYLDCFDR